MRRALAAVCLVLVAACATPPEPPAEQTIRLKSRQIVPGEGVEPDFLARLRTTELDRLHALVQLHGVPDRARQSRLAQAGIALQFHIQPLVYVAAVDRSLDPALPTLGDDVCWIGGLQPDDKIAPVLRRGPLADWMTAEDGSLRVSIAFFDDVPRDEAAALLGNYADELARWPIPFGWYALLPREDLRPMAAHDQVKWIEPGPLPFFPAVNFTRDALRVEETQELDLSTGGPDYQGLGGAGVQLGIWEASGVDDGHGDFAGRIVVPRAPDPVDPHGTQVAGVAAASGQRSAACGHLDHLYRGVAPEAELLVYAPFRGFGPDRGHVADAVRDHGMDVSNHSYMLSWNSIYDGNNERVDGLIRGVEEWDGTPVAPRPMVWAAGNNGRFPRYSDVEGYFSVEATAKNVITVGATMAKDALFPDHLGDLSALGPTWDGRIKPELMAPGINVVTTQPFDDCYSHPASGTSLAAPAVAGGIALLLQQYAESYRVDLDVSPPLPSTSKAVLVQTAKDLVHETDDARDWVNPDTDTAVLYHAGPDFATGYGLVNVQAAAALVREHNLREDEIATRSEIDRYELFVPPGIERIQFTLAWDDEPGSPLAEETLSRLVNDLDLRLVAPDDSPRLPWVLPPLTPAAVIGADDMIPPGDIDGAARGEDHLNNLEQVTVDSPMSGLWTIEVSLAAGSPGPLTRPQPYALAGDFHPRIHFTDWAEELGALYRVEGGEPQAVFRSSAGRVYHAAFASDGTLYLSNANDFEVVSLAPGADATQPVFSHTTYLRDVALDRNDTLHFSEATGAGGDGTIYRLDGGIPVPIYTVRLDEVGGFWAGDFTFAPDGTLFLSTGNRIGASVFRVDDPARASPPVEVYRLSGESITGIAFTRDGTLYFTNWDGERGYIHRLRLSDGMRSLVHSFADRRIWDVAFR